MKYIQTQKKRSANDPDVTNDQRHNTPEHREPKDNSAPGPTSQHRIDLRFVTFL